MNLSRFGMNAVTLAGDLEAKLNAISNAGFQAIDLCERSDGARRQSRQRAAR
jgi:hypothetical protein